MLKVHRRAHFDENKHFRCKICVKSFFNKDKLKTHLSRMNHKQNCISAGFSQDSVIKDVDNKDIVDMPNIGFIISMYCHMAGQCHI
jgi:hypothetical protein